MTTMEHVMSCLGEEAAEVAQMVSKINRFGINNVYTRIDPSGVESKNPKAMTNRFRLVEELNDLMAVVEMLVQCSVLPTNWESDEARTKKKEKIIRYLEYARQHGTVKELHE